MKKIAVFILCVVLTVMALAGCGRVTGEESQSGTEGKKENISKIRPGDYAEGDLSYTLSLSDGQRSVTLKVKREGAVTTAEVTDPSAMTGVSVVYDVAGMRLSAPEGEEIPLTPEAGEGLAVFFDSMAHELTPDEKNAEGEYGFVLGNYNVKIVLDEKGYPCLIEAACGVSKRCAEVKLSGEE